MDETLMSDLAYEFYMADEEVRELLREEEVSNG
jgi:hypothetical protein